MLALLIRGSEYENKSNTFFNAEENVLLFRLIDKVLTNPFKMIERQMEHKCNLYTTLVSYLLPSVVTALLWDTYIYDLTFWEIFFPDFL